MKLWSLLFPIMVISLSCTRNKPDFSAAISRDNKAILQQIKSNPDSFNPDTLMRLGLYNLAMEAINFLNPDDSLLLIYARNLGESGEFDKSNALLQRLSEKVSSTEYYKLKMWFALEKMDTVLTKKYCDSLELDRIPTDDPEDYVERNLLLAVHHHNTKRYAESIRRNEQMIEYILKHDLPERFLLVAYRKLGNDYNDIVRDKVPFPIPVEICIERTLKYYRLEMEIMERNPDQYKMRMALNYITTAMLLKSHLLPPEVTDYYFKALEKLITLDDGNLVLALNPIYVSICVHQLTHLLYRENFKKNYTLIQKYSNIHSRMLNSRAMYQLVSNAFIDIKDYYEQKNPENVFVFLHTDNFETTSNLELLNMSNRLKYPNEKKFAYLLQTYGKHTPTFVLNYFLMRELELFRAHQGKKTVTDDLKLELDYHQILNQLNGQYTVNLTKGALDTLVQYCKETNTTIIDYQHAFDFTIIIYITPNSTYRVIHPRNNILEQPFVNGFLNAIEQNNISAFKKIGGILYNRLYLSEVKTENIIICPDEIWAPFPYDALPVGEQPSMQWRDLNYLVRKHKIYTIPNILSIYPLVKKKIKMDVCLWSSSLNDNTLPYNKPFGAYMKEKFETDYENPDSEGILHILAHSTMEDGHIEFNLNNRTISIDRNYDFSAKMVVLHGCSSGVGRGIKSEGNLSLYRTFLYNGSAAVIYSIWDADNHSSTWLFRQFYERTTQGNTEMTRALREAKLQILNNPKYPEWSSPFYWANFQYIGSELVPD